MASTLFNFSVTDEQKALIAVAAAAKGLSVSAYVRNSLKETLAEDGYSWPPTRNEILAKAKVQKEKARRTRREETALIKNPTLTDQGVWDARPGEKVKKENI